VIDQVMKNASCHDDKMEAHYSAVRALEDKFYGIGLNHITRQYNKEADKLAKIASRRITVAPNVYARDVAKLSVNLELTPLTRRNPRGLPRTQQAQSLWTRTPRTRRSCSPCSRSTAQTRPSPWTRSQPPRVEDWRDKYVTWMDRGELPSDRSEARRISRMARSFTLEDSELYKHAASGVLQ
jgi:hypothetical protein